MGIGKCWNYRLQLITIMLSVMLIMLAGNREINALEATGENKGVGEFDIQKKTVVLNSGYEMPIIGLGTWTLNDDEAENSVYNALKCGMRLIDTARYSGAGL